MIADLFAGGGGASIGIERGCGRPVGVAVNHNPAAIAVHLANHPETRHYLCDIREVDPVEATRGQPVTLLWASPDCRHFSRAKGKAVQRDRKVRSLAWAIVRWAERIANGPAGRPPAIIAGENVAEFTTWGPLDTSGSPIPGREGLSFRRWVRALERLGFAVEWRELSAHHYGAPTKRKRLYFVARSDGRPIVWPEPTHGPGLAPYRTAAECIDWSIPCPSIFLSSDEARAAGVRRPLAEATLRRVAEGLRRFVIEAREPYIVEGMPSWMVQTGYGERPGQTPRALDLQEPLGTVVAGGSKQAVVRAAVAPVEMTMTHDGRCNRVDEPLRTLTTSRERYLMAPTLVGVGGRAAQTAPVDAGRQPMNTVTSKADVALTTTWLAQANTGMVGHDVRTPLSTIVGKGSTQQLAEARVVEHDMAVPFAREGEVRAFLTKYYGTGGARDLFSPLDTATTKARFNLVTVAGIDYRIVDIGLRMLTPRELARAQGFPDSYRFDVERDLSLSAASTTPARLSKTAQYQLIGNSVCPSVAEAIVSANVRPSP